MNVEVNRNAKAFVEESILIRAPLEKVYLILADIRRWPVWQPEVQQVDLQGAPLVGKHFTWKAGGCNSRSVIHTFNPPRELGWTGRMWWIAAVRNWYLSRAAGGTCVTTLESFDGLGAGFLRNRLREDARKSLLRLKKVAERD